MPPLLQFHLKNSIMVGTKEDIQFHLVPTPLGQVSSDKDSEKHEQFRDTSPNDDLKNFLSTKLKKFRRLAGLWRVIILYIFRRLRSASFMVLFPRVHQPIFPVTSFSLVVLAETPFVVIPLRDIEIVNLTHLETGKIDMTVVFP